MGSASNRSGGAAAGALLGVFGALVVALIAFWIHTEAVKVAIGKDPVKDEAHGRCVSMNQAWRERFSQESGLTWSCEPVATPERGYR